MIEWIMVILDSLQHSLFHLIFGDYDDSKQVQDAVSSITNAQNETDQDYINAVIQTEQLKARLSGIIGDKDSPSK